jgi:DNA-binding Lrp family transcriptional regulator
MAVPKQHKLRNVDIKVLEGLALHNPRNRSKLASDLGMSRESLSYRIQRLRTHFSLHLQSNLYHTNIGLRKVFVIAEAKPGYESTLYQCLKANDYWLYVAQCLTTTKSLATYGIPAGKKTKFQQFLKHLRSLTLTKSVDMFWSTCIHTVNVTSKWFDTDKEQWSFPWDSWTQEVETSKGGELPYTLKEPASYNQLADYTDIFILKELEKDCTIRLKEIAKKLDISLELVRYHYLEHIIKKQMLEGPQILADHFKGLGPHTTFFILSFNNYSKLTEVALSLMNKPFVRAVGKVYGQNRLFMRIYLPGAEIRGFTWALSQLIKKNVIKAYEYFVEDMATIQRQTISYEYFKNNAWDYEPEKYVEQIARAMKEFS